MGITSENMTLKNGSFDALPMTTGKSKAATLLAVCRTPGTEQDTMNPEGGYLSLTNWVHQPEMGG